LANTHHHPSRNMRLAHWMILAVVLSIAVTFFTTFAAVLCWFLMMYFTSSNYTIRSQLPILSRMLLLSNFRM